MTQYLDVTLDWETYFDDKYSLARKNITTMDYIRDPRFQILGCSMKVSTQATKWYKPEELDDMIAELHQLQSTEKINLIGQNTKFDGLILTELFNFVPDYWSDTMAMAKGLRPHHPANLKTVTQWLFPNDPSKHKGDELSLVKGIRYEDIPDDIYQELVKYGIQDSDITYESFITMKQWMPQSELDVINLTVRMFCEPKFVLDIDMMETTKDEEEKRKAGIFAKTLKFIREDEKLDAVRQLTGKPAKLYTETTFTSNPQFEELLNDYGVTVPRKTSPTTGKPTPALGKNDVPYLKMKEENSELLPIFTCREELKSNIALNRAKKLIKAVEGRPDNDKKLVVPLVYYQAHTGRYGGNEGLNLQNLQRNSTHRKALTAEPGKLVYVADSSNIEARTLAWFAGETSLVQQFAHNIDTYATLASDIYGFTVDKKQHPGERSVGKVARLGLGYQMGIKRFKATLESGPMGMDPLPCDYAFAEKVVKTYRRTNPKIVSSWKQGQRVLTDMQRKDCNYTWNCLQVFHQCLRLPNGMYLHFPNLHTKEIETARGMEYEMCYLTYSRQKKKWEETKIYGGKLIENICQALAGAIMKEQMIKIDNIMREKYNGSVVLQVHDEVIAIADEDPRDEIMQAMYDVMNTPPSWAKGLPLDSEGGYDTCYSK